MASEGCERSKVKSEIVTSSMCLTLVAEKTFKVFVPTKLGVPIHLVILLRSSELKELHLGHGQSKTRPKSNECFSLDEIAR